MSQRLGSILPFLLLMACAASPSVVRPPPASPPDSAPAGDASASIRAGDEHWTRRADRAELEAALAAWERAVPARPDDAGLYARLARASYLLADGHLAFEGEAGHPRYLAMLERGAAYGEKGLLASNPELKRLVEAGKPIEDTLHVLDKQSVPLLYWYGLNLRSLTTAQGFIALATASPRIKKMMEACLTLDEGYFYGAPHRYLAVFYARAPFIAGGDFHKAKDHFAAALKLAPDYLATRVLWAEFYAVKAEDRDGFKRELEYVLARPDDVLPDVAPENMIEKKKARALLARMNQFFED